MYDDADLDVSMLSRMFDRRYRGYEAIGYRVCFPPVPCRVGPRTSHCRSIRNGKVTTQSDIRGNGSALPEPITVPFDAAVPVPLIDRQVPNDVGLERYTSERSVLVCGP